jgi:hypothetical protein
MLSHPFHSHIPLHCETLQTVGQIGILGVFCSHIHLLALSQELLATRFVEKMRSPQSLEALRIAHGLSDRQNRNHVCGDINVPVAGLVKCWCRIEDGKTQFPHSHADTGNVCREPRCEWHSRLSQDEVRLGQVGNWN